MLPAAYALCIACSYSFDPNYTLHPTALDYTWNVATCDLFTSMFIRIVMKFCDNYVSVSMFAYLSACT